MMQSDPTWCLFSGGTMDGLLRLIQFPPEPGDRYERFVPVPEVYEWDGVSYVLIETGSQGH